MIVVWSFFKSFDATAAKRITKISTPRSKIIKPTIPRFINFSLAQINCYARFISSQGKCGKEHLLYSLFVFFSEEIMPGNQKGGCVED